MRDWANEAKKIRAKFSEDLVKNWDEAIQFLVDYDSECGDLAIVTEDMLDEMVSSQAQEWGYQRVACFLSNIAHNLNMEFYRIDGYGNAQPIFASDIEIWLDDIANS